MDYQNPIPNKMMKTQCVNSNIINTLPQNIIETILSLMPIRDALRTSILSKKWRYSWRGMPKLVFTDDMVKVPPDCGCRESRRSKLVNAIFHVLLLHNGPTVLKFVCHVAQLEMDSEFATIFSYLSSGNNVKELIFCSDYFSYKLPISLFSLQGLEFLHLQYSSFKLPLTFNGFSRLKSMKFYNVDVSAQMLQRFLSKCPLLEQIHLFGFQDRIDYLEEGITFTIVDLLLCVPLIRFLNISEYYMKVAFRSTIITSEVRLFVFDFCIRFKYLSADGMPHKLPASLVYLKHLFLEVCLNDQNKISSTMCIIRSSPSLVKIKVWMLTDDGQTPTNSLDPDNHSDLKLDHLEILEIEWFSNLPIEMEFVKLIMVKSPMLKKVQIKLDGSVAVDEEVEMLRDLVRVPLPRASSSVELIIKR